MTVFFIILAIVIVIAVWAIGVYNGLVKAMNRAEEAESGIDVHLNKRYDLIPNLVETVKGYAKHEEGTLGRVIEARNACIAAKGIDERDKADNVLTGTFQVESEILNARKYYNATARTFNDKMMVFPANLIASCMGFKKLSYVDVADEKKENVKVQF